MSARKGKAKQALDDEAWLRSQQMDIETQGVAAVESPEPEPVLLDVPGVCHKCGREQTLDAGWTTLHCVDESAGALQCGGCGAVAFVKPEVWHTLKAVLRNHFAMRAAALNPPTIRRAPRQRGAG